ncbi:MAG: N-acetyl-gamma-glutamyl-phosphate reductase [Gammaproteobacteria bacterium]|nr:N-acetyl-gamma-glutamyl-phosphate reductase [Gammaproteobacteria bacterium]
MISVGIVGGTGYTGAELLRLLVRHPQVDLRVLTSRQEAGKRADSLFPQLRGKTDLTFSVPAVESLAACRAVFFATPHGTAMQMAPELLRRGVKVFDLSADFRLRDAAQFGKWYRHEHAAPELLAEAAYGLPELNRESVRKARLVACAGCYPTSVQLGFAPLLEAGLVDPSSLIADCKSGVSGAGRELKLGSLFCEAADSMKAYGVAGHRHLPEIEQGLAVAAGRPVRLTFVPHLVPMNRGIHATLYAKLAKDADLHAVFARRYAGEPFVDVLPPGEHPETRSVRGANHCRLSVFRPGGGDTVVVLSAIDNLVKGAAGQAVQCFNLAFGLEEAAGLDAPALWP